MSVRRALDSDAYLEDSQSTRFTCELVAGDRSEALRAEAGILDLSDDDLRQDAELVRAALASS